MAKPIMELLPELQTSVAQMEQDRAAMEAASLAAQARFDAAKAAFEAEAEAAKASVSAATTTFNETAAYVADLQKEVNSVLGLLAAKSRVTVG